ncbi:tripartite tricarboxylate transporter permease [Intestinimonas butyriciproducens]|uniref:tripartite tricarboxylate transporter permease n=1 Tax=Intestinimonas butyriciproducens TaxID=1297617 RepID=UPI00232F5AC3|nr:tripartite tricarboxylate transporter permease [Intestinimonas butyriciproducens]MDB7862032.1 tripartite tricarboxylate transporter permease [Intestinimonas butyriciproducens]MDB7865019.1 tripartite tricarboxylate transporter permease [Intestinimonas butyriciproducens]
MDALSMLFSGFVAVLQPENLLYLVGGVLVGMILGAIPGLSATMAIALVIPLTYYLTPTQSLIMLLAAYNAGTFGGSMSAILIGTPGTVSAAATVADGYALAKQGKANKAIKTALFSSCFGCLFSSIILVIIAQPIAKVALKFGPAEYAVLMLFSLTIIASAAGRSMTKGLLGGCIGLIFGCVGMDSSYTIPRLTFGSLKLSSGIDLVVMLIGALALSEVLKQVETVAQGQTSAQLPPPSCKDDTRFLKSDFKLCLPHWLRCSALGCAIGALPGLGPSLACYLGYDMGHKTAKHPEQFGKGALEGVASAESANNAVCGANMIPLLSLGVPGDTGAALLISAFLVQGLTPGPLIFSESPETVYNVYAGLILCNIVLLVLTLLIYRAFTKICSMETTIIFPCVLAFCVIGVYALNSNLDDVWIMLFFGVIGFVLSKFKFPMATLLIGFILSPLFEKNFRRALILNSGDWSIFFSSPLCWLFWAATILSVFFIVRGKRKDKNLQDGL